MSKIITKKQLDLVIESTLKESNLDPHNNIKENEQMCPECGGMIKEGLCEAGCGTDYMEEELHGNQYKLDKNKNNKIDSEDFEMLRKEGSVEMSVDDLAESVTKTFDSTFLTENMDNFKKLINYRNK